MKKLLLTGFAMLFLATGTAQAADDEYHERGGTVWKKVQPEPFKNPPQKIWQCHNTRVTETGCFF